MTLLSTLLVQTSVTRADVPAIVQAVVAEVAPPSGTTSGRAVANRPLFIGAQQTASALRAVVGDVEFALTGPALTRAHEAREQTDAVVCTSKINVGSAPTARSCEVRNDGVFVSVLTASQNRETGELLLFVRALWNGPLGTTSTRTLGYDMEMYLARSDAGWRVVRRGKAIAR